MRELHNVVELDKPFDLDELLRKVVELAPLVAMKMYGIPRTVVTRLTAS